MVKIGICLPIYGSIPSNSFINFINFLHDLFVNGRNWDIQIFMKPNMTIDKARNDLVKVALEAKCDYIFFIDSDMILPKLTLERLYDMNVPVASGLYFAKSPPYLPVVRDFIEDRFIFKKIIDFGKIIEVGGVGMGCCLIKKEVFDKLEYPWFKFEWKKFAPSAYEENDLEAKDRVYQESEDLGFCKAVLESGFKIYLNSDIVCGHVGGVVNEENYLSKKPDMIKLAELETKWIGYLAEFDKISYKEALDRLEFAHDLYKKEWNRDNPKTPQEIKEWYSKSKFMKYDLLAWHLAGRRQFDLNLVKTIEENLPNKEIEILDFGCGIGMNAYELLKKGYIHITCADVLGETFDFCQFVLKKEKLKSVRFLPVPIHPEFKNKFDLIISFDVLEHVPDEEFEETINKLIELKKENGTFFITTSFGLQEAHPMHFNLSEEKRKLLKMKNGNLIPTDKRI